MAEVSISGPSIGGFAATSASDRRLRGLRESFADWSWLESMMAWRATIAERVARPGGRRIARGSVPAVRDRGVVGRGRSSIRDPKWKPRAGQDRLARGFVDLDSTIS
ncbi:MAG: hypothetical protein IPK00_16500 [Deltaproteobacteria bacterium]|nr:hypothetical protein [Deltaproteobacteria bacterium]